MPNHWWSPIDLWLWNHWSGVTFIAGGITVKVLDFGYDRIKNHLGGKGKRNRLKRFLYRELAGNYNRLCDAIREYDSSGQGEDAPTVADIRFSNDRYNEARKDLMLFDELGLESQAIARFHSSLSLFRGKGNREKDWATAKAVRKSIEDDLRSRVLERKLFISCIGDDYRKKKLSETLDSGA